MVTEDMEAWREGSDLAKVPQRGWTRGRTPQSRLLLRQPAAPTGRWHPGAEDTEPAARRPATQTHATFLRALAPACTLEGSPPHRPFPAQAVRRVQPSCLLFPGLLHVLPSARHGAAWAITHVSIMSRCGRT